MEQSKSLGENSVWEPSTLIRDRPERGEEQEVLPGESDELFSPTPLQADSTRDDAEAKHPVEPRVKTLLAERRVISYSNEIHRRYQNNTYVTGCIVGETYGWLLERGWRKRIIRCMDILHTIHFIERKATWRMHMVQGETNKERNNLKT